LLAACSACDDVCVDVGARYLELILQFRRLAPSLVDSYVGSAELAARVDAEAPLTESELAGQAADLRAEVTGLGIERDRIAWLDGQLRGIEAACEWLGGSPLSYRELVRRCHGVEAVQADESQFEQAHELIVRELPGRGSPRERFGAWMAGQLVRGDRLIAGLEALARELRHRSHERWSLPDDEAITLEIARGQPWAGYAQYRGGLRSLIQINDELPIAAWRMVELVAHEAYPGHHTEHVCKDIALVRGQNRTELSVWVYPTPQALMAEGIAMLAPEILLGEEIEEVGAQCLRPLGIVYDMAGSAAVRRAKELLVAVRSNLALMLDEGRIDRSSMRAYARRWLLEDDGYVDRVVENLRERPWPPYESCYPEGLRACRRFVDGDEDRFGQLLREQLTPATLND
jgi:hypothetical protein